MAYNPFSKQSITGTVRTKKYHKGHKTLMWKGMSGNPKPEHYPIGEVRPVTKFGKNYKPKEKRK